MKRNRVVFSLTTIPSRINNIYGTIKSLSNQTIKADCIYLTLPKKCKRLNTKYGKIPDKIKKYCKIVNVDVDYGPVTKLVGALLEEKDPETIIITVDDDIIYPKTLLEELLNWNKEFPNYALSSSGLSLGNYPFKYSIVFNQQKNNYWFTMKHNKNVDILYGYPGALYKRKFFPLKHNLNKFLKYPLQNKDLFLNDDVYISFWLNKNNIKRRVVKVSDVKNESGNDALSTNVFKFFNSLNRAVNFCKNKGWFKTKEKVNYTETFGSLLIIFILLFLLMFLSIYFIVKL